MEHHFLRPHKVSFSQEIKENISKYASAGYICEYFGHNFQVEKKLPYNCRVCLICGQEQIFNCISMQWQDKN